MAHIFKSVKACNFCNGRLFLRKIQKRNFKLSLYSFTEDKVKKPEFEDKFSGFKSSSPETLLEDASLDDLNYKLNKEDPWISSKEKYIKANNGLKQSTHFISPGNDDLSETSIILFPGQGTQYVGMAKELITYPNVKEMYSRASEILEYDLLKLSCEGPAADLNQTKYQQPAILLASLAAVEKLRHEQPDVLESCIATAGFSIGEITALTFAGAVSFENAVRLVKVRGEAMQIASELQKSGMMVVFYQPDSRLKFACSVAKEFCLKNGIEEVDCKVANYLYPHCKVVAGNEEALQFIIKNKDDFKLKKIKRLIVSGAFHTNLMRPAAYAFKEALKNVHISRPSIPVYSNLDGRPYKTPNQIVKQLPKQIYSPVRWEQTLHILYEKPPGSAFPKTFECGPGKSLSTILKAVNIKAWKFCSNIIA